MKVNDCVPTSITSIFALLLKWKPVQYFRNDRVPAGKLNITQVPVWWANKAFYEMHVQIQKKSRRKAESLATWQCNFNVYFTWWTSIMNHHCECIISKYIKTLLHEKIKLLDRQQTFFLFLQITDLCLNNEFIFQIQHSETSCDSK